MRIAYGLDHALTLQVIDTYPQVVPEHGHGLYALAPAATVDRDAAERWFSSAPDRQWIVHAQAHDSSAAAAIDLWRRTAARTDASFHRTFHVCWTNNDNIIMTSDFRFK